MVFVTIPGIGRRAKLLRRIPSLFDPRALEFQCLLSNKLARLAPSFALIEFAVWASLNSQNTIAIIEIERRLKSRNPELYRALLSKSDIFTEGLSTANFEFGDYRNGLEKTQLLYALGPNPADNFAGLRLAFFHAMRKEIDLAKAHFWDHFKLDQFHGPWAPIERSVGEVIKDRLLLGSINESPETIGIFFLSSTNALGHAILDPYYFLLLHRSRFDRIYFVGPPLDRYRSASRTCIETLRHHAEYIETEDDRLINLSWMNLGEHEYSFGSHLSGRDRRELSFKFSEPVLEKILAANVTLVMNNYWGLLRDAYYGQVSGSAFQINSWFLSPPDATKVRAQGFCFRHGINLDKPLIVLHMREPSYHRLAKQKFRDTKPKDYIAGIKALLDLGYQVCRIGDRSMRRLKIKHDLYFEIPRLQGYNHFVDVFLIDKCNFMIGSQSGPCAYARAFGKPLLSVNAVFHYTLIPTPYELACLKRYYKIDRRGRKLKLLTVREALQLDCAQFENYAQFKDAGVAIEPAKEDEIKASMLEMVDWSKDWSQQPTVDQKEAQNDFDAFSRELSARTDLRVPIGDYLGFALPGYRLSQKVIEMRHQSPSSK